MNFVEIDPFIVGGHKLKYTSSELNRYKDYIFSLERLKKNSNDGYTTKEQNLLDIFPLFSSLKSSIIKSSKQYLDKLGHGYEDLQISNSWGNIIDKDNNIPVHYHSNSYISGVFYINEGSHINFYYPSQNKWTWLPTQKYPYYTKINPEPNLLLLFPSWIEHSVDTSEKDDRVSIAFNIIPKGKFGYPTGQLYIQ